MAHTYAPRLEVTWSGGSDIFYPDAHPESTSVDGGVAAIERYEAWGDIILDEGNLSGDTGTEISIAGFKYAENIYWSQLYRGIFLFNTSSLADGITITGATLSLYGSAKLDDLSANIDVNIYTSSPASDDELVAGDFDSFGSTPLCDTAIAYADWNITGYNNFILNADGLIVINKTGITYLGTRSATHDVGATEPNKVGTDTSSYLRCYSAEQDLTLSVAQVIIF